MTTRSEMAEPTNRLPGIDAREQLLAALPVSERRLDLAGVSTAVLEGGERTNPPLVLLHGPGAYGASWSPVIPGLTATHRVIAPDLPGQGASEVSDGPLDVNMVLNWLGELIEHTCPAPPVVVGQLIGGAIAARFVAESPARVDGLVLVVPLGLAPFAPSPDFGAAMTGFFAGPSAETHDALWSHCVYDLDDTRERIGATWEPLKAYNLDRARTPSVSAGMQSLLDVFGMPAIPPDVLARVSVPTTLLWGRHDAVVPLAVAEAASERYGWPLHVIEQAGNEPAIEAPDAFMRALHAALDHQVRS